MNNIENEYTEIIWDFRKKEITEIAPEAEEATEVTEEATEITEVLLEETLDLPIELQPPHPYEVNLAVLAAMDEGKMMSFLSLMNKVEINCSDSLMAFRAIKKSLEELQGANLIVRDSNGMVEFYQLKEAHSLEWNPPTRW